MSENISRVEVFGVAVPLVGGGFKNAYATKTEQKSAVVRITSANDVGRAVNPQQVQGQIEGAVVQAQGYALMEKLVSVDGVAWGSSSAIIHRSTPVAVVVEARFIPPGTLIQLEFFTEFGVAQTVSTTPLEGTLERSHATAAVVFPSGLSHSQARAAWRRLGRK